MGRVFLSAIVLIITNLIVGSISLSLGLILAAVLIGVLGIAIVLLAVLGSCIVLEKIGWVSTGWTDTKIEGVKHWAREKWRNMPEWYRNEKKRIISMLIERLKGKGEQAEDSVKIWKSVVSGLIILLAIVVVKHYFQTSIGWALVIVAVASLLITFPVLYIMSRRQSTKAAADPAPQPEVSLPTPSNTTAENDEMTEALQILMELHRSGKLQRLLDTAVPEPPIPPPPEPSGEAYDN